MGASGLESADTTALLKQLRVISRVLLIAHAEAIEKELGKLASTDDRKRWWVLFDGSRSVSDVARATGKTERAVAYFVRDATNAGFLDAPGRKPPSRALDYVPPKWLELVKPLTAPEGDAMPAPAAAAQALPDPNQKTLPLVESSEEEPHA